MTIDINDLTTTSPEAEGADDNSLLVSELQTCSPDNPITTPINEVGSAAPIGGDVFKPEISRWANVYPMMTPEQYARLRDHIAASGLEVPLLYNETTNELLDGRNRHKALKELGLPITEAMIKRVRYSDAEARAVIIAANNRRDLDPSQRAAVAQTMIRMADEEGQPLTKAEAAAFAKVSERQLAYLDSVKKTAPEFVDAVSGGLMRVNGARTAAKAAPEKQEIVKAAIATGDKKAVSVALKSISRAEKKSGIIAEAKGGANIDASDHKPKGFLSAERSNLKYEYHGNRIGKVQSLLMNVTRFETECGELGRFAQSLDLGVAIMLRDLLANTWLKDGFIERTTIAVREAERLLSQVIEAKKSSGQQGGGAMSSTATDGS